MSQDEVHEMNEVSRQKQLLARSYRPRFLTKRLARSSSVTSSFRTKLSRYEVPEGRMERSTSSDSFISYGVATC
jgi:hypothetical protein